MLKKTTYLFFLLVLFLMSCGTSKEAYKDYQLAWSDEFNDSSVYLNNWSYKS